MAAAVVAGFLPAVMALWNMCATPGSDTTDRTAERIAAELDARWDDSPMELARAVMADDQAFGVTVLEAVEIDEKVETPGDVRARLVIRIHKPGRPRPGLILLGRSWEPAVTACYQLVFRAGWRDEGPDRINCPAVGPVLRQPTPRFGDLAYEILLDDVLTTLPYEVTPSDVRDALEDARLLGDAGMPDVDVRVENARIALSLRSGRMCLLATRVEDEVYVDSQGGRGGSCVPENALTAG
jgi:hypothetical protein